MKTLGKNSGKVEQKTLFFHNSKKMSVVYPTLSFVFNRYTHLLLPVTPSMYNVYFSFPLFHRTNSIFKYVYTN